MSRDRAGDTSRRSGNSPAITFTADFVPGEQPPEPFKLTEIGRHAFERGFADGETPQAEYFLNRMSYQHASEYFDVFGAGVEPTMRTLHRVVLFDRRFQAILLEYIGLFELQFRAQYSYLMTMECGAFAHRSPQNFRRRDFFERFLADYSREFERQLRGRNSIVAKGYERYGDVPTWQAVEIMSFGTLSKLYNNTRSNRVRRGVADSFDVSYDTLTSWTRAIAATRNRCAHFNRVLGRPVSSRPRRIPGIDFDNGNPFYVVLLLERLFGRHGYFPDDTTLWYAMGLYQSVCQLIVDFLDVAPLCGIPDDWYDLAGNPNTLGIRTAGDVGGLRPGDRVSFRVVHEGEDGSQVVLTEHLRT